MFNPPLLADVKARLADVPNIDEMSLTMLAGRMMFGIHGLVVGLDPGASDDEIDAAIRRALGDKQVHTTNPIAAAAAAATDPEPLGPIIPLATVVPPPVTMIFTPEKKPMSITGAAPAAQSIRELIESSRVKVQAAHQKLGDNAAKVAEAAAALDSLGNDLGTEAADLLAMVGQFKNDLTGGAV